MENNDYVTPEVVDYGTVEDLTAGNGDGEILDRSFPVGTKKSQLTFS